MQVNKAEFLSAMKKALPGVEKGTSIIEGADNFVFSNNAIHSYNDNISVSVPFKHELTGSVKSMDLFKLISKLPTDDLEMVDGEHIQIKSGTVDAEMNKQAENALTGYISSLNIGEIEWKTLPGNFFEAVKLCKIACNRSTHRGIFVSGTDMTSTDTSRINHHKIDTEMERFMLDDPSVTELMKLSDIGEYSISSTWVHFKTKAGTIFSCKRKDDSAYPIQRILEIVAAHAKKDGDIANELPSGLSNVVDRVSTLAMDYNGLFAVEINLSKESMEVKAERTAGKIKEKIKLDQPFTEDIDLNILVDPDFIVEAAHKVKKFFIRKMEKTCALVFFNDNYTQVASTFDKGKA